MGDHNLERRVEAGRVEARHIIKLVFQIAENLERSKLPVIKYIIEDTLNSGKETSKRKDNLRKFYNLVIFKSGISVNLCKQGMRSLLLIEHNPDIGKELLEAIETKLLEQFPTLAGMHELEKKRIWIYLKALEEGKDRLKDIRLMVVGMYGVGKTCLVRRLLNEEIGDVKSTEGIDMCVRVCEINEYDDSWIISERVPGSDIYRRMNDALLRTTLKESRPNTSIKIAKPVPKMKPKTQPEVSLEKDPQPYKLFKSENPPKKAEDPGQSEEIKEIEVIYNLKKKKDEAGKKIIENINKASGRKPTVSIWDFAGRSVYLSTNLRFLSSRSIYLLVLDISKGLDEEVDETNDCPEYLQGSMKKYTCLDAFRFWVRIIYAYTQYQSRDEGKEKRNQAKIVLVATHGDKLPDKVDGKDKKRQKDDYFDKALESFKDTHIREMFHTETFLVSCTEDENSIFNDIKAEISKIAKNQYYWNEDIPARWFLLERFIEDKKISKTRWINFNDVKEADAENEIKLVDEELKLFLKIQHFLGNVMYFDADGLDDTVILDLQWINDSSLPMQIYLKALEKGKEMLKHIRLMVVGMFGVGKTCLVRRLLNEEISDVKSTEGIEINVKVCELNENNRWIKSERVLDSDINVRLEDLLRNTKFDEEDPKPNKSTKSEKPVTKKIPKTQPEVSPVRKQAPPKKVPNPDQPKEIKEIDAITLLKKRKDGAGEKIIENICSIVKGPKASGRKPTVSIWDFAGQSVYYSTHHFFLSSRSIYLLVLDISKGLDEEVDETNDCFGILQGPMKKYTCLDAFKFWVRSIYAYTQYQNMDEDKEIKTQPTILLVATHGDKLPEKVDGKDKKRQKDDYFDKALESFKDTHIWKMFHKETFLVSCTEDEDRVFNDIKAEISKIAENQYYWNEEIPAKWLPLERSIEYKRISENRLINFNDVKEADAENELRLEDKEEIKSFLKNQHFLGNVMYFDADGLDDTVILDPQWIIDIFKLFVNHRPLLEIPSQIQGLWSQYKSNAKLTQPLLNFMIDHSADTEEGKKNLFKENKVQVVGYMEHLDVIAKPVNPKPQVNPKATDPKSIESNKDEEFYFVPCMLKQLIVADENKQGQVKNKDVVKQLLNLENPVTGISTPVLCFVFESKCLPPSIFHRLLATYIKKIPIKQQGTDYLIYNGFGAFELDEIKTLCIWYADFIIYARVKLHDPRNGVLYTDDCIKLRNELQDTLSSILRIDQQTHPERKHLKGAFTEYIMCEQLFEECPENVLQSRKSRDAMDGLHKVTEIKRRRSKNCTCSVSEINHMIHKDEALEYWFEEPKHVRDISAWFKKEEEKDPKFLSKIPTPKDDFSELIIYLPAVGDEFKALGKLLDFEPRTVEEMTNHAAWLIKKWAKRGKNENTCRLLKEKLYILRQIRRINHLKTFLNK